MIDYPKQCCQCTYGWFAPISYEILTKAYHCCLNGGYREHDDSCDEFKPDYHPGCILCGASKEAWEIWEKRRKQYEKETQGSDM